MTSIRFLFNWINNIFTQFKLQKIYKHIQKNISHAILSSTMWFIQEANSIVNGVTEPACLGHLAPLHMTQQLVLKETGFTGSNLGGGAWKYPCSEPSSPMRPRTSLASQKATSQNHAQEFPISLSVHLPVMQTDPHPVPNVHSRVSESPSSRSSSLL